MPKPKNDSRLHNPLSEFSSHTYKISLYMVTPDAYTRFISQDRRGLSALKPVAGVTEESGVYVVAQSGGVNNSQTRAEGFKFDYYIDDLKIKAAINAKSTQSQSNTYDFTFNIIEPVGFSFISNLKLASEKVKKASKLPNMMKLENAAKQFFILEIQFTGYDKNGKVMAASDFGLPTSEYGIYSVYYDIFLTQIKYKLDGKAVVYSIEAKPVNSKGYGNVLGVTPNLFTITATDIEGAIGGLRLNADGTTEQSNSPTGLLSQMNSKQVQRSDPPRIVGEATSQSSTNLYCINWNTKISGIDLIKKAEIVTPLTASKLTSKFSSAAHITESTVKLADGTTVDLNSKNITISSGTSIMKAIETIIMQSDYLEKSLKLLHENELESIKKSQITNPDAGILSWYSLSTQVVPIKFDEKSKEFSYRITYTIQPYMVPALYSPYINKTANYYGPHKRYSYWLTGKNSEILKYEQVLNNNYFVVALATDTTNDPATTRTVSTVPSDAVRQGFISTAAADAASSVVTNLSDPGNMAEAKLTILGDPDFLMNDPTFGSPNAIYDKFYGTNGFTINANGGHVFIEVDFKEGVDYDHDKGLLTTNSNILLWDYTDEMRDALDGLICYMVTTVDSTFSKGSFTQVLTCTMPAFPRRTASVSTAQTIDDTGRQGK